jgi:hypothetical protein
MNDKEKLQAVRDFVSGRKAAYESELKDADTEVAEFVFSQMIALLDEVSAITEQE